MNGQIHLKTINKLVLLEVSREGDSETQNQSLNPEADVVVERTRRAAADAARTKFKEWGANQLI